MLPNGDHDSQQHDSHQDDQSRDPHSHLVVGQETSQMWLEHSSESPCQPDPEYPGAQRDRLAHEAAPGADERGDRNDAQDDPVSAVHAERRYSAFEKARILAELIDSFPRIRQTLMQSSLREIRAPT